MARNWYAGWAGTFPMLSLHIWRCLSYSCHSAPSCGETGRTLCPRVCRSVSLAPLRPCSPRRAGDACARGPSCRRVGASVARPGCESRHGGSARDPRDQPGRLRNGPHFVKLFVNPAVSLGDIPSGAQLARRVSMVCIVTITTVKISLGGGGGVGGGPQNAHAALERFGPCTATPGFWGSMGLV